MFQRLPLLPQVTFSRLQQLQRGLPFAGSEPLEDLLVHGRGCGSRSKSDLKPPNLPAIELVLIHFSLCDRERTQQPARWRNSHLSSGIVIPIARAVVSAKLSFG